MAQAKKVQPKKATRRRLTGQPRLVQQPLSIDLLPMEVHESIKYLRAQRNVSWPEIERLSSLPYADDWAKHLGRSGFVNWESLPLEVLNKFPDMKLPHSNLHRWWDVRVEQASREVLARGAQARELAQAFAAATVEDGDEAVINAARDVIFGMLQDQDNKSRTNAAKALLALGEITQQARANTIKERRVAVDEKKLKTLEAREELTRRKLEQETDAAAAKVNKGEFTLDDLNAIRQNVWGLPPVKA